MHCTKRSVLYCYVVKHQLIKKTQHCMQKQIHCFNHRVHGYLSCSQAVVMSANCKGNQKSKVP